MSRKAVFFDRDGTLVKPVPYPTQLVDLRVFPDAPRTLQRLQNAGYLRVVVTNQAAIAKGRITRRGVEELHHSLSQQLLAKGGRIDAWYLCPFARGVDSREVVEHLNRKPGPGMLLEAAEQLGIDLSKSWIIGDTISDALAGRNAGCRGTIFVGTGEGSKTLREHPAVDYGAVSLTEACDWILDADRLATKKTTDSSSNHTVQSVTSDSD